MASASRRVDVLIRLGYETDSSVEVKRRRIVSHACSVRIDPVPLATSALPRAAIVLVAKSGDDRLLLTANGRRAWHSPREPGGHNVHRSDVHWDALVETLERLPPAGAELLLVPERSLPWFRRSEHLRRHLDNRYACVRDAQHRLIFDLSGRPHGSPGSMRGPIHPSPADERGRSSDGAHPPEVAERIAREAEGVSARLSGRRRR